MSQQYGLVWRIAQNTVTIVPMWDGSLDLATVHDSNVDGSVLVGESGNPARPMKWTNFGTVAVPLPLETGDNSFGYAVPRWVSQDGSVIVGTGFSDLNFFNMFKFTETTVTALPMLDGWSNISSPINITSLISDDGSIIIGTLISDSNSTRAVKWTNEVLETLPNPSFYGPPLHPDQTSTVAGISHDGSVIFGLLDQNGQYPCVWTNGTPTTVPPGFEAFPTGNTGDGTLFYGSYYDPNITNANGFCYWNLSGDASFQTFSLDGYDASINAAATHHVMVGQAVTPGRSQLVAVRWHDATPSILDVPPDYAEANVVAVSGDGTIATGWIAQFIDQDPKFPVYWDEDGHVHILPMPEGTWGGTPFGISRDGNLIYGYGYTQEPPHDLQLVSLYPVDLPANVYALTFNSDFPDNFTQYSLSVWCCKTVHIQWTDSNPPAVVMDFSPSRIAISLTGVDGSLRFAGVWTVSNPKDQYQVLFSVDTIAQSYTLFVNDVIPIGTPSWGVAGSVGWQ